MKKNRTPVNLERIGRCNEQMSDDFHMIYRNMLYAVTLLTEDRKVNPEMDSKLRPEQRRFVLNLITKGERVKVLTE